MSVVPKQAKKMSVRSGKREPKAKGRCLVDDKCDVVCEPPISFCEEEEEQPASVEVPVVPVEVPVVPDESSCVAPVLESIVEEFVEVAEDVAVRVLSECKTKVWNAVTKRWLKLDGKKAKQLGL
jgi:hypothetical protein